MKKKHNKVNIFSKNHKMFQTKKDKINKKQKQ
jgi:hypothetical protein